MDRRCRKLSARFVPAPNVRINVTCTRPT